jgi:very-short-patch-repair endonuclease
LHGMRVFAREGSFIHLVVPRGAKVHRLPFVQVHESRRFGSADISLTQGYPCTEPARSAVDAAAWQPWPRFAMTMMAATVQQRIASTVQVDHALARCGRVCHKRYMRLALKDIAGGAESLGEIDFANVCRRFRLRPPDRQVRRTDPAGRRRYLDCEWILEDGTVVVLEIDGAHHLDVEHWEADMRRERRLVTSRRLVLRATAAEVRFDPADVVTDLRALGVPTCQNVTGL